MTSQIVSAVTVFLIGDAGCGKSSFLRRVSQGVAGTAGPLVTSQEYSQPVALNVRMYNRSYELRFYDEVTKEIYAAHPPDMVIYCYSIDDKLTLENCQGIWKATHSQNYQEEVPTVLLGLKRDLRAEVEDSIHPQEGHSTAQRMRCDRWAECSALTGELFKETIEDILRLAARTTTEAGALSEPHCAVL